MNFIYNIAKDSDSFARKRTIKNKFASMLRGANREMQRCIESNCVLSSEAHRVMHSQHAFSLSL